MATARDIIAQKGRQVHSIPQDATVLQAVRLMMEHKIGGAVVTDQGRFVGIFTERDLMRRVVGEQRDPSQTRISEVMTCEVVCCRPETSVEEARGVMRDRRIRHLPVLDGDGQMLGLISIGDLNAYQLASQEQTIYMLHEYLYGRV